MYVDNYKYYGHLVNNDDFTTLHLHNDMYQLFENKYVSILKFYYFIERSVQ